MCWYAQENTPLHRAAECNLHDVAELLLDHGANIQAIDADGKVPRMTYLDNYVKKIIIIILFSL